MKTLKITKAIGLTTLLCIMLTSLSLNAQIHFEGLYSQGEGGVAWDADGTGPEPAATGHQIPFAGFGTQLYYGTTRDYIDPDPDAAGFHLQDGMTGFPLFELALSENGFTPDQVKVKMNLFTLEDDIEGEDWFIIGDMHYANYYNLEYLFEVNGESMISGANGYSNYSIKSSATTFFIENSFTKPVDASSLSSPEVQAVADAFLQDLAGDELRVTHYISFAALYNENGRDGAYFDIFNGIIEKGLPTIPFQGLAADHEGMACWDTDGTGPEPLKNGHLYYPYFSASRDYDGIDPDPNAAFCRFLEGNEGFTNFFLQLAYREYNPGQVKIKSGPCDMDEDIEGEDWNGDDNFNLYHGLIRVELDGEPLFGFMIDTFNCICESVCNNTSSFTIAYNASENSSPDMQMIANAFLKDLESRYLQVEFESEYISGFTGNGRSGGFHQINSGNLTAKLSNCTRIDEGDVSGQWLASGSPYIIEGLITIPAGETLTIEPGVWIN